VPPKNNGGIRLKNCRSCCSPIEKKSQSSAQIQTSIKSAPQTGKEQKNVIRFDSEKRLFIVFCDSCLQLNKDK
jgi:hypothetical protein